MYSFLVLPLLIVNTCGLIYSNYLFEMKQLFFVIPLVFFSYEGFAQPRPPSVPVPLDGGLITLLIAGAAYGSKKIFNNDVNEN